MDDKPRRWFQVHLLTCLVMMSCAGGILYVNFQQRKNQPTAVNSPRTYEYGWPVAVAITTMTYSVSREHLRFEEEQITGVTRIEWQLQGAAINIAVCVLALFLVGGAMEVMLRRRYLR